MVLWSCAQKKGGWGEREVFFLDLAPPAQKGAGG